MSEVDVEVKVTEELFEDVVCDGISEEVTGLTSEVVELSVTEEQSILEEDGKTGMSLDETCDNEEDSDHSEDDDEIVDAMDDDTTEVSLLYLAETAVNNTPVIKYLKATIIDSQF